MTEPREETDGQEALFDRDLNPTPEALGFPPESAQENAPADPKPCVYCRVDLRESVDGRLLDGRGRIQCDASPHYTHETVPLTQETPC